MALGQTADFHLFALGVKGALDVGLRRRLLDAEDLTGATVTQARAVRPIYITALFYLIVVASYCEQSSCEADAATGKRE